MRHPTDEMLAFLHDELRTERRREIEGHLETCAECRQELDQLRAAHHALGGLPLESAPDDLWSRIEAATAPKPKPKRVWLPRLAFAGGAVAAVALGLFLWLPRTTTTIRKGPSLAVAVDAGNPQIGAETVDRLGLLHIGEELQTGADDKATITMKNVGKVTVHPNSRVGLLVSSGREQRLDLKSGGISAEISAPPQIFFVETKLATAVDLGCKYTLTVDDHGNGKLVVTQGWVELVGKKYNTLVRAGSECEITPAGPGIPYESEAAETLVAAIKSCESGDWTVLASLLGEATDRDALTLWHLLHRAEGVDREQVYQALARLAPPPDGASKADCLALDAKSLEDWREDFAPMSTYDFWNFGVKLK